jgi:acyl dehydratase
MTDAKDAIVWDCVVEAGAVRAFARAVHDDHADAPVAPPTFPISLSAEITERLITQVLRLDRHRTVHGEQEYEYLRPLKPGDTLRCRARVVEDYVKQGRRGGAMRFVVWEAEMSDAATGEIVLRERSTAIEMAPVEGGPA